MKKNITIEPGLLQVFRLLTGIRLSLTTLNMLESLFDVLPNPPTPSRVFIFNFVEGFLLLGYLSWPKLQKWLGRAYLPLGIVIASVGPTATQTLWRLSLSSAVFPATMVDVIGLWQLLPSLMVALIIVAWQYNFRSVVLFSLTTAVLDVVLVLTTGLSETLVYGMRRALLFRLGGAALSRTAILVLVGFMVSRLMHTQRKQRQSLLQANLKLTHYATTLEQLAISRERNRLARELHDTLAHTLSALAVQLGAVDALWDTDQDEARTLLNQSLTATRSGLTETRRALHALRATPLEDLGLTLALRALCDSVSGRNDLDIEVEVVEPLASEAAASVDELSPTVQQCIYRVTQETLENVVRHANAQHVTVKLVQIDHQTTLTIADDGTGFELDTLSHDESLGLRGIQERAEMVGGELSIDSQPGKGTTVRLTIQTEH